MLWIKEVEITKSDPMTSQSIEGRDFTDSQMLDAKISSAVKRIISKISTSKKKELVWKSRPLKNTTDVHEVNQVFLYVI